MRLSFGRKKERPPGNKTAKLIDIKNGCQWKSGASFPRSGHVRYEKRQRAAMLGAWVRIKGMAPPILILKTNC